jgi:hypothetical protein
MTGVTVGRVVMLLSPGRLGKMSTRPSSRQTSTTEESYADQAKYRVRPWTVQIITPPGALTRIGQKPLVKDVTGILVDVCGDPSQAQRTWALLTEAAEGGRGIGGTAVGRDEFAALAAAAAAGEKK